MERRGIALAIAIGLAIVVAILFYTLDPGTETAPVDRVDEQNRGANAPLEQVPSPGTTEDPDGDPQLAQ